MTAESRFPFTKTRLLALPVPEEGRAAYHDAKCAGLILRVTPNGQRSFCFYRKVAGRPVRLTLGQFPGMTVEQARKLCNRVSNAVAEGKDPQADRRARREELTFQRLWEHWQQYAQAHKKTWQEDERMYRLFLSPWANRKLSAIKKADVQGLHHRIALERGKYQANRLHELIRAMYNRARDIGYQGENPAFGVTRFSEEKRDRFLHGDELKHFFEALAAEPSEMIRSFFLLSLLTGARRSNVQAMAWADIDFATALWRIPETKSGKPVVVPLTGPALAILAARREAADGSPWVFPSYGQSGHLVEPKGAWKRVCQRAGLQDVRIHDLRRSLASHMAMAGVGLPIVGKMLGHTQSRTTEIYARLAVQPVRQAAELATVTMLEGAGVKLLEVEKGGDRGEV